MDEDQSLFLLEGEIAWNYNQLQRYLSHCTLVWPNWPAYDFMLVNPLLPFTKVAKIQDHAQPLEEQLWMGGRREVIIVFHRRVTSSDLQ